MMHKNYQNTEVLIRWCAEHEIEWVNEKYQRVDFKPSHLNTDRIAIAVCGQERVGLGRLCQIGIATLELGGMYILPDYRGLGIARKLVRFMVEHCKSEDRIYCLPFAHLRDFYQSEGFEQVSEESMSIVPNDVIEKHRWCKVTYPHEVLLLQLSRCS